MAGVYILDAVRTPWGKFGGALKEHSASDLGALVIAELLRRTGTDPGEVENVLLGQVLQAGQGQLPSRQALVKGGLPETTPSTTINKVCGSGMRAVVGGAPPNSPGDKKKIKARRMEKNSK